MQISRSSPLPLHHQLRDILERQIRGGVWAPHEAIPTEYDLADRYGLSRTTVRQAISTLVVEGLLYRQQGKGTFVAPPKIAQPLDSLLGFIEILQRQGQALDIHVFSIGVEPAASDAARALALADETEVVAIKRRVDVEKQPLLWDHSYLPANLLPLVTNARLRTRSVLHLLEEAGHRLGEASHTIATRAVTPDEAMVLQLEPGSPVMVIRRTVYADDGRPLDYSRAVYRSDRYEFEFRLRR
jgi:GntR family transcriptional regulator